jgi:ADP-ribose 1''-phosphate phosphatase
MTNTLRQDLFSAPEGSLLIHAVNCKGVWGSGIAKEFAQRYPLAKERYKLKCSIWANSLLGTSLILREGEIHDVGCLFTSKAYGAFKDSRTEILDSTRKALEHLLPQLPDGVVVFSNLFNSGLFDVPWRYTEKVLRDALVLRPDITWNVCVK